MSEEENKKKKRKKEPDINDILSVPSAPQSKSFQKLEDLLKMESANSSGETGVAFDEDKIEEERKKLEERRKQLAEFKKQIETLKTMSQDGYMDAVSKMLVEKGLSMLDALQKEIEDSPRGRDVETAAAMMSAINGIIDNLNKQKVYNIKLDIEKQKLEMKKASMGSNNIPYNATQNNVFFASTTDLIDMLQGKKPFPENELKEAKDVSILKDDELEKK